MPVEGEALMGLLTPPKLNPLSHFTSFPTLNEATPTLRSQNPGDGGGDGGGWFNVSGTMNPFWTIKLTVMMLPACPL